MQDKLDSDNSIQDEKIEELYRNAADIEIPDLWNRIETGIKDGKPEDQPQETKEPIPISKKRKIYVKYLAAAAILLVLAIPAWFFLGGRHSMDKSASDETLDQMENAPQEDQAYDSDMSGDSINESAEMPEDSMAEDSMPEENAPADGNGLEGEMSKPVLDSENMTESEAAETFPETFLVRGVIFRDDGGYYIRDCVLIGVEGPEKLPEIFSIEETETLTTMLPDLKEGEEKEVGVLLRLFDADKVQSAEDSQTDIVSVEVLQVLE